MSARVDMQVRLLLPPIAPETVISVRWSWLWRAQDKFPLAAYAKKWHVIQEPGELVYIPSRCPHAVRNLDDIHVCTCVRVNFLR